MRKTNINKDWLIQQGEPVRIPMLQAKTRKVDLPHDFMIEGDVTKDSKNGPNTGFYNGATYTYTKTLFAPEEWKGQRVLLSFDGVYGYTTVLLNKHIMGTHHYGYTPFTVDLTKQLRYGEENSLAVLVSNENEPNSRWYSGGGIYRDVSLLVAPKTHIAPDGLYLHTDHLIGGDAFVIAEAEVENHTDEDFFCWVDFVVKETTTQGKIRLFVPAGESVTCRTQLCIENVKLWDVDDPNVYEVEATLLGLEGEALDQAETLFGVRTISVDSKNGFVLNGRPLKLKGGCLHHDNGILGAVSEYGAEYRKLKAHKENGFNAIRCAHNPASAVFLEACDRLGLVVIEEAFDSWVMPKNLHDFSEQFALEWERELTAFMKRDRNHPSIVLWSIGNELREQGNLSGGYRISRQLADAARKIDATRPICGALCSFFEGLDDKDTKAFWMSLMEDASALAGGGAANLDSKFGKAIWNDRTEAFAAPWDVVGYNYLAYHYEEAGQLFPNRVVCCTESKPLEMLNYWRDVEKYPYLIGDFVWTSQDYIGEAGIGNTIYTDPAHVKEAAQGMYYAQYPWRCAGTGDFDLLGGERAQMAYRRIVWGSEETYILVHNPKNHGKVEILGRYGWTDGFTSWNVDAKEGDPVTVEVYSKAPEVELFLNGQSVGKKATENLKVSFEVIYEAGTLTAVSLEGEAKVSEKTLVSGGAAAKIDVTCERPADGELVFAKVEITDENGLLIPAAENALTASLEGTGTLLAFGSARPKTEENYTKGECTAYRGTAMAVIRLPKGAGAAKLTVASPDGLRAASVEITA